jgi:hypothetical protein
MTTDSLFFKDMPRERQAIIGVEIEWERRRKKKSSTKNGFQARANQNTNQQNDWSQTVIRNDFHER